MPMGKYWYVPPNTLDSAAGKVREASGPGWQVKSVLPLAPPLVAVIVEVPSKVQVTDPLLALITICGLLEDQLSGFSTV